LGLHDALTRAKATSLDLAHLQPQETSQVYLEAGSGNESSEARTISMSVLLGLVDALYGFDAISQVIDCVQGSLQYVLSDLANACPINLLHLPPKAVASESSCAKLAETIVKAEEFQKGGFLDAAKNLGLETLDKRLACEGMVDLMTRLTERFSIEEQFSIEGLGIASKNTKVKTAELALLCKMLSEMHCIGAIVSYIGIAYLTQPETVIHNAAIQSDVKSACLELDKAISAFQSTLNMEELRQTLAKDGFVLGVDAFSSWLQRAQETSSTLKHEIFALLVSSVEKLSDAVARQTPNTSHIVNDKLYNRSQCKKRVLEAVDSKALSASATSLFIALECGAKDFAEVCGGLPANFEDTYEALHTCRGVFEEAKTCIHIFAHLYVIQKLTAHTAPTQAPR
jgi:hypothetical protein